MNKAERTRQYIIKTASPIFNKKGYAGTSISDIVESTGLTKGSIYGNFGNKVDLAIAALEYNLQVVSNVIFDSMSSCGGAIEKLSAFAGAYSMYYDITIQMGGCPVMNAAVDSDDGNTLLKKKVVRFINAWKKNLIAIIEEGKAAGEIRHDADSGTFSMIFISLIEGSLMLSKTTGDRKYLDSAVDHLLKGLST